MNTTELQRAFSGRPTGYLDLLTPIKRLFPALCLCGLASGAFGQGLVQLANNPLTLVTLSIPGSLNWPPPGSLLFGLVTAPAGTTDLTVFKPTGVLAINSSVQGLVSGETVAVPGWPVGETRAFAIVGWSAILGTNFNPAWLCLCEGCLSGFGVSRIGSGSPGGYTDPVGPPHPTLNPFAVIQSGLVLDGPLSPELCPTIVTQPLSQSALCGSTVTFTVVAQLSPFYQWQFNGTNLPGATSSALVLTNVQISQAGAYSVTVWNLSAISSSLAMLVVTNGLPTISTPPQSQTTSVGADVDFVVRASGPPPLAFYWFFNGTSFLSGSTNSVLELADVQSAHAGAYTVVVTNAFGAVTSAPAMLSVIPVVERSMVPALTLMGQPGSSLNLEDAQAPSPSPNWVTLDHVALTNTSQWYFDLSTPLPPQRFYRAWQPGPTSVASALDLHMVPALTLTGTVGSSVRVDYINQFGPTDAWVTLNTVTLTNTSQLYFDVSAIGQPPRLWRIVPVP